MPCFPMRIVSGKFAGRHLTSPGRSVRPTAEGVRDRLIGLLEADLPGTRVLDLFAGSGAIGLEALSRGARYIDFVENGAGALHSLKANVAALSLKLWRLRSCTWCLEEGLSKARLHACRFARACSRKGVRLR